MAKKERNEARRPQVEVEVPLKKGAYVWLAKNPPHYSAYDCECRRDCGVLLWGGSLAVRDHRGYYHSLMCALHEGITTREESKQQFQELLRLKQGGHPTTHTESPTAPVPPAPVLVSIPPAPVPSTLTVKTPRKKKPKSVALEPLTSKPSAAAELSSLQPSKLSEPLTLTPPTPPTPTPPTPPATKPLISEPLLNAKKQRPKLPQSMSPKRKEVLAADALANAPQHVKERLARRNGC